MRIVSLCVVVALALSACTRQGERRQGQSPSDLPTLAPADQVAKVDAQIAPQLRVDVACSATRLRTAVATVTWSGTRAVDPTERLDIAASKQGFVRGQFLKVFLGEAPRKAPSEGLAATANANDVMGRTLNLQIETPSSDGTGLAPMSRNAPGVRVVDLEPGVVYFFRVARSSDGNWSATEPVRVEAPTCVADVVGEER